MAEFLEGAVSEMLENALDGAANTIATMTNYSRPLASVKRGTLRRGPGNSVDIDLPAGPAGDAVISAHEDVGVVLRPFLDPAESVSVIEGDNLDLQSRTREGLRVEQHRRLGRVARTHYRCDARAVVGPLDKEGSAMAVKSAIPADATSLPSSFDHSTPSRVESAAIPLADLWASAHGCDSNTQASDPALK